MLYLALLSCSLCSVKLHIVLLYEQIKKEGRKEDLSSRHLYNCLSVSCLFLFDGVKIRVLFLFFENSESDILGCKFLQPSVPIGHQQEMAYGESNDHVSDDVT